MLAWLFGPRRSRRRAIFKFHDGTRTRYADPAAAWAVFERECGEEWPRLVATLATVPPPQPEGAADVSVVVADFRRKQQDAADRLAAAACIALGVAPLDPLTAAGLTRAERVVLASELLEFVAGLAEGVKSKSSSPPPTGASPAAN